MKILKNKNILYFFNKKSYSVLKFKKIYNTKK